MVNTEEHSDIRVRPDAEPQHHGRMAVDDTEEARPHPAEWTDFRRECCTGCSRY